MLHIGLGGSGPGRGPGSLELLLIGAHSDDIEIGCGGTVMRLLADHPGTRVTWVVLSANDQRAAEARASADDFLTLAASSSIEIGSFRESYFPHFAADVKDYFNGLRERVKPDIVFCHRRADEHQDHRTVAELTWNTFRDHLILEYEIVKYEGDLGHPNVYVTLPAELVERKVDLLMRHFGTQRPKRWFRSETFRAMLTLRGVEAGVDAAEAFHGRKLVV